MIEVRYFCRRGEELTVLDCSHTSPFHPDDRSSMEKKTLDW